MASNTTLHKARKDPKDEFYTQLTDIENELRHYKHHFEGKVVYCNCDDPYESNFFKFFAMNFEHLGLKKLIATSYSGSPVAGSQLSFAEIGVANGKRAHKIVVNEVNDYDGNEAVGLSDVEWLLKNNVNTAVNLMGDGDFHSAECTALLEEADIVVTNPPFSLFRPYVAKLMEHNKRFLILGDQNAITYKEIFPLLKDETMWLGVNNGGTKWFRVPMDYDIRTEARKKIEDGIKYISMGRINWFTNLDNERAKPPLTLFREYNPAEYPTYDNYDAINVDKVADIPVDYYGVMGVPITYMAHHIPATHTHTHHSSGLSKRDGSMVTTSTTEDTSKDNANTDESSSNVQHRRVPQRQLRERLETHNREGTISSHSDSTIDDQPIERERERERERFKILSYPDGKQGPGQWIPHVNGQTKYARVLIQRSEF